MIVQANETASRLLIDTERGLIGRLFLDFLPYGDRQLYLHSTQAVAERRHPLPIELRQNRNGGRPRWIQLTIGPWQDEDKRLRGWHLIIEDISLRKQTEKNLQDSQKELQNLSSKLLNAQETERSKLASELHDQIVQPLAAIKFRLEHAQGVKEDKSMEEGFEQVNMTIPLFQSVMQAIDRIYMGLRPSVLDDFGIASALDWLCRRFHELHPGIGIGRNIEVHEWEIRDDLKPVIYRIAQQAVENAITHGKAKHINLTLTTAEGNLDLWIRDEGAGFDVASAISAGNPREGVGLASMKQRVELTGGVFFVDSVPGQGSLVRASWPL
jgi:PAS domain S-box-containing protein